MTATALRQERIAGIAVPIATLAVAGIAIVWRAVGDNSLALLHDVVAFVSTLSITGGLGFFLIVYSVLFLLKPDSLRIKLSGWRSAWQWAPPEALSAGFQLSQDR